MTEKKSSLTKSNRRHLFRKPKKEAVQAANLYYRDRQRTGEKRMKKSRVILRLLTYLAAHKGLLALSLFLTVLANGIALITPKLSEYAVAAIEQESGVDFSAVTYYVLWMLLFYFVSGVLSYFLSLAMIALSRRVVYTMRKEVFEHLLALPVSYFDQNQAGDIISRLSYDIDTINASLSNDLVAILAGSITVIGSLVMMATISLPLLSVFAFTIPVLVLFTRYRVKKVKPLFRARSHKLGELNGYVEEILSGQRTIRAFGKEEVMIGRFDLRNDEAVEAYFAADYQGSVVGPGVNFITNMTISLISMFGALLFIKSTGGTLELFGLSLAAVTAAKLSSFILYARKFLGPVNETANIISEIQSATSAAERIFRLLDEPTEEECLTSTETAEPASDFAQTVKGRVEICDLSFAYTPDHPILKHISVNAAPGQTVAIVGPTGSGKTTVVNLLMRFYDAGPGKIFIDGQDITSLPLKELRRSFAMVLQDTWLFGGTVEENIAYGSVGATHEEVVAAAKATHIHAYIESLPQGYDTVMDENGMNISKGQKQLITIARMMLVRHPILILDEATSNVDSRTEKLLTEAMQALMAEKTCFIIAHRLSTIQNADCILVIKDGEVIERGRHEELLAFGGFYASLYNAQFDSLANG